MNYRSRYAHNIKNKKNKFLLEEHFSTYQPICDRLKDSKALMDKLGLAPQVRTHERQSLRFVNETDEGILQDENECNFTMGGTAAFRVIKLGNISQQASEASSAGVSTASGNG